MPDTTPMAKETAKILVEQDGIEIHRGPRKHGRRFPDGPQYSGMRHDRTAGLRPRGSATVDKWQNPERGAKLTGYSAAIVPPVRRHISGNRHERHHRRNHRRGRARLRSRSLL